MSAPSDMIGLTALADETISAQIAAEVALLLADRNALPNHPALRYVGSINGSGSNAIKVPFVGLMGYDLMATATEGDPVANTALTDTSATVTVVEKTKVYEPSDLGRLIDRQGILRRESFVLDAVMTGAATLRSMIANLVDNFSNVVGTSGAAMTARDALDAITTLEVNKVEGPYLAVIHPRQWGHLRNDIGLAGGGAVAFSPGSEALLSAMKGLGYKGSLFGVDWFTTTDVVTSGSDHLGGMFGNGALLWADGDVAGLIEDPISQFLVGNKIMLERGRVSNGGTTKWVSRRFLGAAEGLDAAGVSIQSSTSASA